MSLIRRMCLWCRCDIPKGRRFCSVVCQRNYRRFWANQNAD